MRSYPKLSKICRSSLSEIVSRLTSKLVLFENPCPEVEIVLFLCVEKESSTWGSASPYSLGMVLYPIVCASQIQHISVVNYPQYYMITGWMFGLIQKEKYGHEKCAVKWKPV